MTPRGIGFELTVHDIERGDGYVSCGFKKDSGDDPDVTNGMIVYARVEKTDAPHEIFIDGGVGIGRVTKPGLDQPVGNAAINSTPRRMISGELRQVCEDYGYAGGGRQNRRIIHSGQLRRRLYQKRTAYQSRNRRDDLKFHRRCV